MEVAIVLWIAFGIASAVVASSKGYNGIVWGLLGIAGGIITLLVTLGLSDTTQRAAPPRTNNDMWN